jgi:uncharacterized protein (DUF58 family)
VTFPPLSAREGEGTTGSRGGDASLLPPATLEKLGGLAVVHRYVVQGFMAGAHRSVFRGAGDEFSRHRAYQQGDDTRRVDWRLFGRTDRLYVREYREDSNLQAWLVVDRSLSMGFPDGAGMTKLRYAAFVAAALAHLMLATGDAVGLASFGDGEVLHLPPRNRRGAIHDLLLALERLAPAGRGGAAPALDRVGEALRRRGRVILLSDLLEDDGGMAMVEAVGRLRARGDEVMVLRPLTPLELGRADAGPGLFHDPEAPEVRVPADPSRDPGYVARVEEYYRTLGARLREQGAEFVELVTDEPVEFALAAWLRARGG